MEQRLTRNIKKLELQKTDLTKEVNQLKKELSDLQEKISFEIDENEQKQLNKDVFEFMEFSTDIVCDLLQMYKNAHQGLFERLKAKEITWIECNALQSFYQSKIETIEKFSRLKRKAHLLKGDEPEE